MPQTDTTPTRTPREAIGDALVAAGTGIPDTFPVVITAQAGTLADAVLAEVRHMLADHTRELADMLAADVRADRERHPGGGDNGRNHTRRGAMLTCEQRLRRYAEHLDQRAAELAQPAEPAVGQTWAYRPQYGTRTVTITQVGDDGDGVGPYVAYEWDDDKPGKCGSACPMGVFLRRYQPVGGES